jgi:aminomuconate-semialdehyde/2-hydroxymuconate-6-semialdehyde dehydrogenase
VVTLQKFSTRQEALSLANATRYGLASVIWSRDNEDIHFLSQGLESGIVWINCWLVRDLRTPFGGIKQSGIGREGGWDAMKFFTEVKSITQVITNS